MQRRKLDDLASLKLWCEVLSEEGKYFEVILDFEITLNLRFKRMRNQGSNNIHLG